MESTAAASAELYVLRLLEARYGSAQSRTRLSALLKRNPQLDPLDWSLLVMSIEIDLRVRMSPSLLDAHRWTVGQFARSVASLAKLDSVTHTVDLLTLLSEELLRTPVVPASTAKPRRQRPPPKSKTGGGRATSSTSKNVKKRA